MSLGFISSRRRLTTTASLQMGDGERGHVAGNQDDPRPSPPNGTDRASPQASVHSQAHWGLEMELRRPGVLAARLLRVVSGSPAAARVLGEEQQSPQFRIPSHRIARVPPRRLVVEISKTWSSPVFVSFLGNVDLPKTRLESPSSSVHRRVYIPRRHPPPSANQVIQHAVAGASNCLLLAFPPFAPCLVSELCIHLHRTSCRCLGSSPSGPSATFTLI